MSPEAHRKIEALPKGIIEGSRNFHSIDAYSTYLHETIHWRQHNGETLRSPPRTNRAEELKGPLTRQALNVFRAACKMVDQSPILTKRLRVLRGTHRQTLTIAITTAGVQNEPARSKKALFPR